MRIKKLFWSTIWIDSRLDYEAKLNKDLKNLSIEQFQKSLYEHTIYLVQKLVGQQKILTII